MHLEVGVASCLAASWRHVRVVVALSPSWVAWVGCSRQIQGARKPFGAERVRQQYMLPLGPRSISTHCVLMICSLANSRASAGVRPPPFPPLAPLARLGDVLVEVLRTVAPAMRLPRHSAAAVLCRSCAH